MRRCHFVCIFNVRGVQIWLGIVGCTGIWSDKFVYGEKEDLGVKLGYLHVEISIRK